MNYALIENETVTNIIWLYEGNENEFPGAVKLNGVPAQIGDAYANGQFTRGGETLLSPLQTAGETIAELDTAVVDLTYENIMLEYEL